mgnify:CR=1 FL=1
MTNEEILKLAKDNLVRSEYTEFGWQECERYEFDQQELEAFYRAAFNAGLEAWAKACDDRQSEIDSDAIRALKDKP